MITLNGKPAFVAEKLSLGRVRITTEDRTATQVFTAPQLIDAISNRHGKLHTQDSKPPTARDRRVFGNGKPFNELARQLEL